MEEFFPNYPFYYRRGLAVYFLLTGNKIEDARELIEKFNDSETKLLKQLNNKYGIFFAHNVGRKKIAAMVNNILKNIEFPIAIKLLQMLSYPLLTGPFHISHSILTLPCIKMMKKYEPILEIASGYGLNAKLLRMNGVKVIATDIQIYEYPYVKCEIISGIEAVEKYKNHTLFMCWPPYDDPIAYDVLKKYTGMFFIFVGNIQCGNDDFFELLQSEWEPIHIKVIDSFIKYYFTKKELNSFKYSDKYKNQFIIYKRK